MRLTDPKMWIGLLSAGAVLYLVFGNMARKIPGALTAVHQRIPELRGRLNCSKCHGGWWVAMTESCLNCHDAIDHQIDETVGLHGSLDSNQAKLCVLCHSDHHGENFAIVNDQSFALAGIPDPGSFDHHAVGFKMDGKHLEIACTQCHQNADVQVLAEGSTRFLGLDQDCTNCHDNPHKDRNQLTCAQCHGQKAFDHLASQGHERHLDLVGGHADLNCRECHAQNSPHSLESLGERWRSTPRTCNDCHDSPHDQDFIEALANAETTSSGASCVTCHKPEHLSFRDNALTMTAAQHAETGFSIEHPHEAVNCEQCHLPTNKNFALRHPGRSPDECAHCHEDPHGGQFDHRPYTKNGCIACHDRQHFDPVAFDAKMHAESAFELTGSHLDTDCHTCHELPAKGEPRTFNGTPKRCEGCHMDAHYGFFDKHGMLKSVEPGTCAACHLTTDFSDNPNGFDHGRWTGFTAEGAHAQDGCIICHPRSENPDDRGRTLGRVVQHFGTVEGCHSCHVDPHQDSFVGPQFPIEVDGNRGCARCHSQISFRTFADGFDHQLWTGFAISGAHAEAGCSSCHEPLVEPTEHGRTWGHAASNQCAGCHDDPHAGQFVSAGRNDCARCHRSAISFTALSFNHSIHSRFLLGKAHENLACSACHIPVIDGDVEYIRYRPLKTTCVECHGKQSGPLRHKRGKK